MSQAKSTEREVERLRNEVKSLQETFHQLTEESKNESYDVRRSYMLKAQIVQLERQCMLLSEALSARASVMIETENALISLIKDFQELLAHDVPGPTVEISRKQLISHIQNIQKLKGSLHKQAILTGGDNLRIPQLSGTKFSKTNDVTCIDICSGKIDHINLQHVAYLESKLVKLHKKLTFLQTTLEAGIYDYGAKRGSADITEKYLCSPMFKNLQTQANDCVQQLEDCCQDLLCLSLLHPSSPWSVIKKSGKYTLFEASSILQNLPPSLRQRKDVKSVIISLCKAHNYILHVLALQLKTVKEGVFYSSQVTQSYVHFMNSLLQGVTHAYRDCETSITNAIRQPLGAVMKAWISLKENQCEDNLRIFMNTFKRNEGALQLLVEETGSKESPESESGVKMLQDFGLQLEERITMLKRQCMEETVKLSVQVSEYVENNELEVIEGLSKLLSRSQEQGDHTS